ncbi:MAG TPA: zinc ribbon domain-containing protein [Anaerolineales bacterium]|nr:zinc ribbon domain-containing protein [Anaerolineales bacterium]HLO28069.1 zinc ribbon domain-containing protein [Anaerolineales bacterium]
MEIFALFIGLALFAAGVAYISLPFRQRRRKDTNSSKVHIQQEGQREVVLAALRDLDFDFKTGKVSEEDYKPLRAQLMAEAAQYIEAEKKEDEQLEAAIQTRRKTHKENARCEQCGASMEPGQRFCPKCSSAVNQELCPSCGKKIQAGDLFCSSCGNKIRILREVVGQS